MSREVRVLAVEDRPWWMQPLFSFPFAGDLSVRQVLLVTAFIVIAIPIYYIPADLKDWASVVKK